VDEYHEHPNDILFDCFSTGTIARTQPLILTLTTAGTNTSFPCFDKRNQIIEILSGSKINEEIFGIIYTIDKEDDWTDFKVWKKANPNYNVSVFEDSLKKQYTTAIQNVRKQNIIKCKHLNLWCNAGEAWINMVEWDKCGDSTLNINDFAGDPCYLGLDLASKIDVASSMPLFKRDGHYYLFSRHYIPEERTKGEDMAHYAGWVHDGYIKATEGNRIDFDYIKEYIREIAKNHDLSGEENGGGTVANDPWNAQDLITQLMKEDINPTEVSQTPKYLSEPMKEIEACIKDGKFHHDDNPATNWMFSNVSVKVDFKDNVFPRKEVAKNKIDAAVATINAMSRAMATDAVEYGDAASCFA
jgi:phage terminase large subunit-like protein